MFVSGSIETLWNEVCHEVRCRRYLASHLTDIFEAVSRSPSLPEEVSTSIQFHYLLTFLKQIWNLMTHALTPDRLERIKMPHFVSMLDSLSRIQCKDKYGPSLAWMFVLRNDCLGLSLVS